MRTTLICWALSVICTANTVAAQVRPDSRRPIRDTAIVSPSAQLERVFGDGLNTEGPAVAFDGSVYFVDLPLSSSHPTRAGRIWRFDPETGKSTIYRSPSGKALGIEFDTDGRMVVAEFADFGGRRVTRTDLTTGDAEIVAALYNGRPFNGPNDLTIDEKGRIYFTDYRYAAPHEVLYQRVDGVYRIHPDRSIERVTAQARLPNGIVVSPDQKTLYVTSGRFDVEGRRAILAFDLSPEGEASFRSIFAIYEPSAELPDGMAVDVEGNVYVALYSRTTRTGVAVYSPQGTERAFIATPEPAKNVAFGREAQSKTLYITAGRSLYRIHVKKDGYQLPTSVGNQPQ